MLRQLKALLKQRTYKEVAEALGYKSPSTILSWIKLNKIPNHMREPVKAYIKANKK